MRAIDVMEAVALEVVADLCSLQASPLVAPDAQEWIGRRIDRHRRILVAAREAEAADYAAIEHLREFGDLGEL